MHRHGRGYYSCTGMDEGGFYPHTGIDDEDVINTPAWTRVGTIHAIERTTENTILRAFQMVASALYIAALFIACFSQ